MRELNPCPYSPLFQDDVALQLHLLGREAYRVRPVAENLEGGLENVGIVGRDLEPVQGVIVAGLGVQVGTERAADRLEVFDDLLLGEALGAVERHVFHEVCQPALVLFLEDRAGPQHQGELGPVARLLVVPDVVDEAVGQRAAHHRGIEDQTPVGVERRHGRGRGLRSRGGRSRGGGRCRRGGGGFGSRRGRRSRGRGGRGRRRRGGRGRCPRGGRGRRSCSGCRCRARGGRRLRSRGRRDCRRRRRSPWALHCSGGREHQRRCGGRGRGRRFGAARSQRRVHQRDAGEGYRELQIRTHLSRLSVWYIRRW